MACPKTGQGSLAGSDLPFRSRHLCVRATRTRFSKLMTQQGGTVTAQVPQQSPWRRVGWWSWREQVITRDKDVDKQWPGLVL